MQTDKLIGAWASDGKFATGQFSGFTFVLFSNLSEEEDYSFIPLNCPNIALLLEIRRSCKTHLSFHTHIKPDSINRH